MLVSSVPYEFSIELLITLELALTTSALEFTT
jgi:hypothetical protein